MKKKVVFLLATVLIMASCREKDGSDAAEQTSFETMTVSKQDRIYSSARAVSVAKSWAAASSTTM